MKGLSCTVLLSAFSVVHGGEANPLGTVLSLLEELTAKVTKDREVEAKAYAEYVEWCDDSSKNVAYSIQTSSKQKAKLEAHIQEFISNIDTSSSKIEDLASAVATADSELKDATDIRKKEAADFASSEQELVETVDTLSRAIGILEREMANNPAFAQLGGEGLSSVLQAFGTLLDAAAVSSSDQKKLTALIQSQQMDSQSDDDGLASPAAAMYKTHSTNILDVLEDLKEKAEAQLNDLRKAEVNTKHNFNMLKQSLEDQSATDTRHMVDEKASRTESQEGKSTAEGDLAMTEKDLANSKKQQAIAKATCLQTAADHEATVAARKEELVVIVQAQKVLQETSPGAVTQTYSFAQVVATSGVYSPADLAGRKVVEVVKHLAKVEHSSALAQLASRIAAVAKYEVANGEDPFAKIKGLIQDMISKLEKEAGSEATEKAYCDEQIGKTELKKGELEDDIEKMSSRIDQSAAKSAQLKAEIQALEAELAALTKLQAEMDRIRSETHAEYAQAKAVLELGVSGVRKALAALREYYGNAASMLQGEAGMASFMEQPAAPVLHSKSEGAGGSIINILEVVESDFATNLAKEESEEADAQSEYQKVTQENAVTKELKEQDVKYKTKTSKSLDATVSEYSSDRETANTELRAVLDFYSKIKERCIAKPEGYEVRKRRREAEIDGLREALSILADETALVQRKRHAFRSVRGAMVL